MTTTPHTGPGPTIAARFSRYDVHAYVAVDTIDLIAERVRNLLTGRTFVVVRAHAVKRSLYEFPEVTSNVVLDTAYRGGMELHVDRARPFCALSVYGDQGVRFGLSGAYATEQEVRRADHDKSHQGIGGDEVVYVNIEGGSTPDNVGRASVINIVRTNQHGYSEQIVVKPNERRIQ